MASLTFLPMKLQCVVVLRDGKVVGSIRRRKHWGCLVSVPGILYPARHPGKCCHPNMAAAKAALLAAREG